MSSSSLSRDDLLCLLVDRTDPIERGKLMIQERRGRPESLTRLHEVRASTPAFDRNEETISFTRRDGRRQKDRYN